MRQCYRDCKEITKESSKSEGNDTLVTGQKLTSSFTSLREKVQVLKPPLMTRNETNNQNGERKMKSNNTMVE